MVTLYGTFKDRRQATMVSRKQNQSESVGARPKGGKSGGSSVRPIGSWVNQLLARRGYAQVSVNEAMAAVVADVLGESLKDEFQIGNLKAGKLHVYAADSVILQELNFRKRDILSAIEKSFPDSKVTDLRFRIQAK